MTFRGRRAEVLHTWPGKTLFLPRDRLRARSVRDPSRGNIARDSFDNRISIHPIVHSAPSPPLCPIRHSMIHHLLNCPTRADFAPIGWRRTPHSRQVNSALKSDPDNLRSLKKCRPNLASLKMYQHSLAHSRKVRIAWKRPGEKHPRATAAQPKTPKPQRRKAPRPQRPKGAKPQCPNAPTPQRPKAHRTPKISPAPIPCAKGRRSK
jgi:hypothetical protein